MALADRWEGAGLRRPARTASHPPFLPPHCRGAGPRGVTRPLRPIVSFGQESDRWRASELAGNAPQHGRRLPAAARDPPQRRSPTGAAATTGSQSPPALPGSTSPASTGCDFLPRPAGSKPHCPSAAPRASCLVGLCVPKIPALVRWWLQAPHPRKAIRPRPRGEGSTSNPASAVELRPMLVHLRRLARLPFI